VIDHPVLLDRDAEMGAMSAAVVAAQAGHGAFVMVEGPPGIGKTTLLRAACDGGHACGAQVLTARGLALERGFSYGIVRQLLEPVRAAGGPDAWRELLDGAAGLAVRVFDAAEPGAVEDDTRYATMHGLYWLVANLSARRPVLIAIDDGQWADAPSLRWLAHLAARIDGLPVALLLTVSDGPDPPALLDELRTCPACTRLRPGPLGSDAAATLVRRWLGDQADAALCQACQASTGGNPFLLESLATALRVRGGDALRAVDGLGPQPVAQSVLRRAAQAGTGADRLTRAIAVLGGPASLRHAATLASQDIRHAARLADSLRAADVLAPGTALEFAHPIVRAAVYESIPPGERALAHAEAADLLERDGADPERVGLHLVHSEPGGNPHVTGMLRTAAAAASGRGAPGAAADYLRRAVDEPPDPGIRPAVMLELGLALAADRSQAATAALRRAVELAGTPPDRATTALQAARVLGIWGHHDSAAGICRDALGAAGTLTPAADDNLEAELFANAWIGPASAGQARQRARGRLSDPGASSTWRIHDALRATAAGEPAGDALARIGPVLADGLRGIPPDSLAAVYALLVLIWNDELGIASGICESARRAARERGSMSMVAHVSCLCSMIARRLGHLEDAAADAMLALEFKLETSPPVAVAWAASFCIDALTCLGRLDEAEAVAAATAERDPPPGWIHTNLFQQARGALRVAQHRPADALGDLLAAGAGWRGLGIVNPAIASWRTAAATAHLALGQPDEAVALTGEQLALARGTGCEATLGIALRAHATAVKDGAAELLAEAIGRLEKTPARYELAVALAAYGAHLRRTGQRSAAQAPLRRAVDLALRTGAARLAAEARQELLATGARPRRAAVTGPDALTSAERRVACLASEGLSNRQIAQHLFITQATVETHLRHAFAKLGVTSRTELPGQLA